MYEAVQKITSVPGVTGAAVFDESGACLAHDLRPPYEAILLTEILGQLREIYDNYLALADAGGVRSFIGSFDAGHLLIRQVDRLTLMVIASESANLAMLGVSINVALLKLARADVSAAPVAQPPMMQQPMLHQQPMMQQPMLHQQPPMAPPQQGMRQANLTQPQQPLPPQPPRFAERSQPPPVPQARPPMVSSSTGERSTPRPTGKMDPSRSGGRVDVSSTATASISWTNQGIGGQKPPADAVGLPVMRHVLKALARRIGPAEARAIVEGELMAINATPATVRAGEFTDLIRSIASRLNSPADRDAFISDALGDAG